MRTISLLICLFWAGSLLAEEPRIDAELESGEAFLGDAVSWTVRIKHEDGWKFTEESLPNELGEARVLSQSWTHPKTDLPAKAKDAHPEDAKPTAQANTSAHPPPLSDLELHATVAWYKLGEVSLPSISLTALDPSGQTREFKTPEMKLTIKGVLKENDETPARDKDQLALKVPPFWLMIVAGILLVLLLIGAILYWRSRPRKAVVVQVPPPPPPYEEAIAALQALTSGSLLKEGHSKAFYGELHLITRRYYGRIQGVPGEEMTSTEIEDMLEDNRVGTQDFRLANRAFQALCDRVKFAKYEPYEADTKGAINSAFQLVEALRALSLTSRNLSEAKEVDRVPLG